jgi:hypothetical protein
MPWKAIVHPTLKSQRDRLVQEFKSTGTSAHFAQRTPAWEACYEVIGAKAATQWAAQYRLVERAALRQPHAKLVSARRRNIWSTGGAYGTESGCTPDGNDRSDVL